VTSKSASRNDVAELLQTAGYELEDRALGGFTATIASSPYAVVACVEVSGWKDFAGNVMDVQADLTRLAEGAPSARNWDLYVVALVNEGSPDARRRSEMEQLESDTNYARKFVFGGLVLEKLDAALRPLLPLRPAANFAISDPLAELRAELLSDGVDRRLVDVALQSFDARDEVEVP
jgi:hypothetical protein